MNLGDEIWASRSNLYMYVYIIYIQIYIINMSICMYGGNCEF